MRIRHYVFVAFAGLTTAAVAGPTNVAPLGVRADEKVIAGTRSLRSTFKFVK